VPVKYAKELLN